ncbi:MAG: hypothetical protein R2867_36130 [Caldilineaceae bacterium]
MGVIQRGDRTLQLQQPLTPPPPLAWSDEQILARLALTIAKRLRDPDTAALNQLDPDAVDRAFRRYVDAEGGVDAAGVFDHVVHVSRQLNVYNRLENGDGQAISHAMLRSRRGWVCSGRAMNATHRLVTKGPSSHACAMTTWAKRASSVRRNAFWRGWSRGDEKLPQPDHGTDARVNYKRYVARYRSRRCRSRRRRRIGATGSRYTLPMQGNGG